MTEYIYNVFSSPTQTSSQSTVARWLNICNFRGIPDLSRNGSFLIEHGADFADKNMEKNILNTCQVVFLI